MTIVELVARTFSFRTEYGRFIFRPWGASGPCYLLSPLQRAVRAWIQLAFYGSAVSCFAFVPAATASTTGLLTFVAGFTVLGYVLYGLFCIGLPQTEKPPKPSNEQRRVQLTAYSRELGKPILWLAALISWVFFLAGITMALLLNQWGTGILVALTFGAFGGLFTWQLLLIRKA